MYKETEPKLFFFFCSGVLITIQSLKIEEKKEDFSLGFVIQLYLESTISQHELNIFVDSLGNEICIM